MRLTPSERHYLGLLVELAEADSEQRRRDLLDRILAEERYGRVRQAEHAPVQDVERYLANWWTPAIREMATFADFQADAAWIAGRLFPRVDVTDVERALATLFELGFLVRDAEGRVLPREVRFRTAAETTMDAAGRYQREVVSSLLRQLDTSRHAEQHALAVVLALDVEQVREAKLRLNTVVQQIAALADAGADRPERQVYHLGLQLLPLMRPVEPG